MKPLIPVFLIDLDSVLLEPLGYRKAVQSTLNWFTERMGLGDQYPGEEVIASLEAVNMTSEWDMVPVLLAAIIDGLMKENPGTQLPEDLLQACDLVRSKSLQPPNVDFASLPIILGKHFKPGMEYSTLAFELNQTGSAQSPYPNLIDLPILKSLLLNTRALDGALSTRVFQHFTLGSERFAELSGHAPLFECDSYLEKFDRHLLNEQTRDLLLMAWRDSLVNLTVYTARPSKPEKDCPPGYNYSPEAEVALETLGLQELPLIATGQINWLSEHLGVPVHKLGKPSPVQALAAIAAAYTRQVETSLLAAADLQLKGKTEFFQNLPGLAIHVFEDSGGNTASVRRAVDLLNEAGLICTFNAWGIGDNPDKQRALMQAGAELVPDINQAVLRAFQMDGISVR